MGTKERIFLFQSTLHFFLIPFFIFLYNQPLLNQISMQVSLFSFTIEKKNMHIFPEMWCRRQAAGVILPLLLTGWLTGDSSEALSSFGVSNTRPPVAPSPTAPPGEIFLYNWDKYTHLFFHNSLSKFIKLSTL